jgi:hypothetical protein
MKKEFEERISNLDEMQVKDKDGVVAVYLTREEHRVGRDVTHHSGSHAL